MRSPSYSSVLTAQGAQPGYLVQINLTTGYVARLCSLDVQFTYGGYTWNSADVVISGMGWDSGGGQNPTMTLGDADRVWFTYAALGAMSGAAVYLWQCYAASPGNAEPMWYGRIGAMRQAGGMSMVCNLLMPGGVVFAPRRKVQDVIEARFCVPAGSKITINGQVWTIGG